ncbi:MAG: hypothetical protein HOF11_19830 [Rhodospirillaceae bacterium]|nr:hypothetical protein [Rhodospirillaceae bacterium]
MLGLVSVRDILDAQQEMLFADIDRRQQEEEELRRAYEALETRISERTEDLRQALAIADTANKSKSDFLANISHELRTPLNAIIGFSEIIGSRRPGPTENPEYQGYAKEITAAGHHLLSTINDILDLSNIESGRDVLVEEEGDIPGAIRSMMAMVQERAMQENIELDFKPQSRGEGLWADERKIKQILSNFLSNAVKFTEPGGKVTIRAWSDPNSGYVIQVADTGIGIASGDIPKALTTFVQIDSELNRKYEGTGLGLPLAKILVEMHGGSLDLQSQINAGTTVTARFPASRIRSKAPRAPAFI